MPDTHPSSEPRELSCERCNREHRIWSAASPIWNAVVRGGCINGDEEYAFLCANCFMELAEDREIASGFRLTAERTNGLELTTPSGRTWSDTEFCWIDAKDTHPSSDVLERLRSLAFRMDERGLLGVSIVNEAADTIERLSAELERAKEALNFHEACQKAFAVNGKFWVTEENVRGNYGVSASPPPAR